MPLVKKENQRVPKRDPLEKPDYTEADVQALRAVFNGVATPDQQRRSIDWLLAAFGTYDTSYRRGGSDADRDTIFAEGRRHAGTILLHMLKYAETSTDPDKIAMRLMEIEDGKEQAE